MGQVLLAYARDYRAGKLCYLFIQYMYMVSEEVNEIALVRSAGA